MIKRHQREKPVNHARSNGRANGGTRVQDALNKPAQRNGKQKFSVADGFRKFAHKISGIMGSPWAFFAALLIIIGWAILGPVFGFSDTWQLIINTATTIVTFLMVFLIQNTQNRDANAIHLKLDELIHAAKGARNKLIDLENCSDEDLLKFQEQFKRLGELNRPKPRSDAEEKQPSASA